MYGMTSSKTILLLRTQDQNILAYLQSTHYSSISSKAATYTPATGYELSDFFG